MMRILLATDGSSSAAIAASLVSNVPWPVGSSVDVVRVIEDQGQVIAAPWPGVGLSEMPDAHAASVQAAEDAIVELVEPLRCLGLQTDRAVLRGRAADAILDRIDRHRPDIVIVGNRGRTPLERTLLGSVSAELVDGSPVPILVARKPTIDRVLVAVDGSEVASDAVASVRRWPFLAASEIRVLSVMPTHLSWSPSVAAVDGEKAMPSPRPEALESLREHEAVAAEAAALFRTVGFRSDSVVATGTPASTIVDYANDWDADLVIMGSHGRTGLTRLVLGSVARSVLHHAGCSVLIVRRQTEPVRGRRVEALARPWTILGAH
jgi:nucleotide-binding universal stress UspA family protein